MVTKSQVTSYQPLHFSEAAEHFGRTAAMWEAATAAQHFDAMNLPWEGAAAAAYRAVAIADDAQIVAASGQAEAASQLAAAHGVMVWQAKQEAVYALEDADAAGFDVAEDFTLTDRLPTPREYRAERQAEMMLHTQNIGAAVATLVAQDGLAAASMAHAGDFSRYHTGTNGHIFPAGKGHMNGDGQCDDPDYQSGVERRLGASMIGGFMVGGLVGGLPGAISGAAGAGIGDLIREATGDGPDCR